MSVFRRIAAVWDALWFSRASPYPVAAFRILLGLYLCVYFATLAPHVTVLFSSHGVYAPYLVPDYAPPPAIAWALFGLLWALCVLLLLGVRTRITIPCLLALYFHHYFLSLAVKHSSFERLLVIYLIALWPAHADAVWALRPSVADIAKPYAVGFTARLVRFQTIVLYLGAGLWKACNPAWHTGTLLHATLQGVWATPLAFWLVRRDFGDGAWTLASYAVIVFELLLGLCLWIPRARPLGIALGIAFHTANSVILAIPEFLVCLAPYVFFVPERTLERLAQALRRRS